MKDLKNIKLFLLDMDGTIYLGNQLFDGSLDFINKIRNEKKQFIFLTNNSSVSRDSYINKLNKMGISVNEENIFTSGMALAMYLNKNYPNIPIYLSGTNSLKNELSDFGIKFTNDKPRIVVVGFDRELTYQKLEIACKAIDEGAIFLATNIDYVCPIEDGRYIPDCGSICKMITNATKKEPYFIGKPKPDMINILKDKYNLKQDEIAMIGDRIYTDIACGYNAGVVTICVLSGESTMNTINESSIKPDYIFNSIKDLIDLI